MQPLFDDYINVQLMSDSIVEEQPKNEPQSSKFSNMSRRQAQDLLVKVYAALRNLDDANNRAVLAEGKAFVTEHSDEELATEKEDEIIK